MIDTNKNLKGFTLIELLVVISISGLISSLVLVSLKTQRMKAKNVATISSLQQFRNWQELYLSTNNVYIPDVCGVSGETCKICTSPSHTYWNWPPNALIGPNYFSSGIKSLYGNLSGCMNYRLASNPPGYEIEFGLYYLGEDEHFKNNQALGSMFNVQSDDETPCEWLDENLAGCYIRYR